MSEGLAKIGMQVLPVYGSYFVTADFRPLGFNGGDDAAFCQHTSPNTRR